MSLHPHYTSSISKVITSKCSSCSNTNLFECSWNTEEFIHGIQGNKKHGGHGHTPAQYVGPVGEGVLVILQSCWRHRAGYDHKLSRQKAKRREKIHVRHNDTMLYFLVVVWTKKIINCVLGVVLYIFPVTASKSLRPKKSLLKSLAVRDAHSPSFERSMCLEIRNQLLQWPTFLYSGQTGTFIWGKF